MHDSPVPINIFFGSTREACVANYSEIRVFAMFLYLVVGK